MIQKYQKKPVTIEAIQFKEENIPTIKDWLGENLLAEARYSSPIHWIYRIKTLEGNMLVTEGDYIIRGVKGEFYPCKPDIFYATYDGPTRVLWNHTTGEYDQEYLKQQESIDAGQFVMKIIVEDSDTIMKAHGLDNEEIQEALIKQMTIEIKDKIREENNGKEFKQEIEKL